MFEMLKHTLHKKGKWNTIQQIKENNIDRCYYMNEPQKQLS